MEEHVKEPRGYNQPNPKCEKFCKIYDPVSSANKWRIKKYKLIQIKKNLRHRSTNATGGPCLDSAANNH